MTITTTMLGAGNCARPTTDTAQKGANHEAAEDRARTLLVELTPEDSLILARACAAACEHNIGGLGNPLDGSLLEALSTGFEAAAMAGAVVSYITDSTLDSYSLETVRIQNDITRPRPAA